ncbi:MAG: DUF5312 family protein [Spirochaetaceae bacterium]|jgi:hypothetical protein|nr:DUF5312 family protein [Spirochaetaceae bacterium]
MLLDWFFSIFSSLGNSPSALKKNAMRRIAKEIKKSNFSKFYNPSKKILTVEFASFFYSIYLHIESHTKITKKFNSLESAVINFFLNSTQKALLTAITYESIKTQSKKLSQKLLKDSVLKNIEKAKKMFTPSWMENVNKYYNLILNFAWIASFDFFSLIKLFDPNIKEEDYFTKPYFSKLQSVIALENIKDFLAISVNINVRYKWSVVFEILSEIDSKNLAFENWNYIVSQLTKLQNSKILENIIKHTEENPYWENNPILSKESIAEKFIAKTMNDAEVFVENILKESQNDHVDIILKNLYGENCKSFVFCKYNSKESLLFENRGFNSFVYSDKINYSYIFYYSFFVDIKQLCDILIVHGEWSSKETCNTLSSALDQLSNINTSLTAFIRNMSEDGILQTKMYDLLNKSNKERRYKEELRRLIADVNFQAKTIVVDTIKNLTVVGKIITELSLEKSTKKLKIIINWALLDEYLNDSSFNILEAEKKINDFLLLVSWDDPEIEALPVSA